MSRWWQSNLRQTWSPIALLLGFFLFSPPSGSQTTNSTLPWLTLCKNKSLFDSELFVITSIVQHSAGNHSRPGKRQKKANNESNSTTPGWPIGELLHKLNNNLLCLPNLSPHTKIYFIRLKHKLSTVNRRGCEKSRPTCRSNRSLPM